MAAVKLALVTAGDPRRPDEVVQYTPPRLDPDSESSPSVTLIMASIMGLAGLFYRVRAVSWLAAFFTLSAYATIKQSQMDAKQLLFSAVFSVLGITSVYILPPGRTVFGTTIPTAAKTNPIA